MNLTVAPSTDAAVTRRPEHRVVRHTVAMRVRSGFARPVRKAVLAGILAGLTLVGCTSGRAAAPASRTAPASPAATTTAAPFPAAEERTKRGDPDWSVIKV